MKLKLKTSEIYKVLSVLFLIYKNYKVLIDSLYVRIFRFFSKDDKVYIVYNNLDVSIYYELKDINFIDKKDDESGDFDLMLNLVEFFTIFKNMKNIDFCEFDIEKKVFSFQDSIFFNLKEIFISEEIRNKIFKYDDKLNELKFSENYLDDKKVKDLVLFRKVFLLKNTKFNNLYFYDKDSIYFNFFNIFIKKNNIELNFGLLDLFNLNIFCKIIKDIKINKVDIKENVYRFDNNLIIKVNSINKVEDENKYFLQNLFKDIKIENEIIINLEFFNFVKSVIEMDSEASIVFDNGVITINTNKEDLNYVYRNDIKFDLFFVINVTLLYKVLKFVLLVNNNLNNFRLSFFENDKQKYIIVKTDDNNIEIAFEVLGDVYEDEKEIEENIKEEEEFIDLDIDINV